MLHHILIKFGIMENKIIALIVFAAVIVITALVFWVRIAPHIPDPKKRKNFRNTVILYVVITMTFFLYGILA